MIMVVSGTDGTDGSAPSKKWRIWRMYYSMGNAFHVFFFVFLFCFVLFRGDKIVINGPGS